MKEFEIPITRSAPKQAVKNPKVIDRMRRIAKKGPREFFGRKKKRKRKKEGRKKKKRRSQEALQRRIAVPHLYIMTVLSVPEERNVVQLRPVALHDCCCCCCCL